MSNLVPASHVLRDGEPWYQANMLATTLGNTERAVRKLAARLPENERAELEVPTLGGSQTSLFVSRPGAIEIALLSKSPVRAEVVRNIMGALASRSEAPAPALQALEAEVTSLRQRLDRLEATPRVLPSRFTYGEVPRHEVDAFDAAWREAMPGWGEVTPLVALCLERRLLPSLLDATMDVRGHGIRLGRWLAARVDVDKRRTTNGRRIVRLSNVVALATRRGA